jgi:drug/metabolite transporter (DMT)-like permease
MEHKKLRSRAMLYLIITAILWSFGGVLIKSIDWNPIAIAGGRSFIAAIVIIAFKGMPSFKISKYEVFGAIGYAATVILFVSATKLTTSVNAILLQYTAPIYVALFSFLILKERITRMDWATIGFVLIGMSLFFIDKLSPGNLLGNILAILSGVSFASVALFLRKLKDVNPINSIIYGNILTFIVCLPFIFKTIPNGKSILALIVLGVFQLGISYIFYAEAIKNVSAIEAILVPIMEPILNPIWVFLFIGEKPSYWCLIGGLIVLVSVTLRCIYGSYRYSKS